LPPVVESAEQDLHVVVGADPVAVGQGGVDRAVRLERPDAEMDRGGGIPDQDFGRIGGGNPVRRRELGESGEHRRVGPGVLGEPAVHLDVGLDPRRPDLQIPRPSVVDDRGIDQDGQGERQVAQHRGS